MVLAAPADVKTNAIDARIMILEGDMVVGRYFVITNDSRAHWYDVQITIDGGYAMHKDIVRAGERLTLFLKDFSRDEERNGTTRKVNAKPDTRVSAVTVKTRDGAARTLIDK